MSVFREISASEWDVALRNRGVGSVQSTSVWERAVTERLPFVTYRHYQYNDTHVVRMAEVSGRLTAAPFAEGSDVVALGDALLDVSQFIDDISVQFGTEIRLRINSRFAPVREANEGLVVAHEHVVSLAEDLLPRVRKTLRHILQGGIEGHIETSKSDRDVDTAYQLYVRHMRSVSNFVLPKSLFVSLIREHGADLWVWRFGERVHAVSVFLPQEEEVLYALSAADRKAFAAHAPHHLLHQALMAYQDAGIVRASLGATGADSPLETFKRGWRGESYSVFELGARAHGVSRTSRLRSLARYVPLSLYPLFSAKVSKYLL